MRDRLARVLGPLLGVGLFCAALFVLHGEFAKYDLGDVLDHLGEVSGSAFAASLAATAVSYLLLTGYDGLALRWIGRPLAWPRVALASFVSFAFSHNLGVLSLDGSLVRYRMLSSWGLAPGEIARVVAFDAITFWLGFLALGGVLLTATPLAVPESWSLAATSRPVGLVLAAGLVAYLCTSALRRAPIRVRGFEISLPGPRLSLAQLALSSLDWLFSASVLWLLLPPAPGLSFPTFVGVYLLAVVGGIASHVPGGVGVFETALVVLLSRWLPGDVVLGSAILYRISYYLVPMAFAVALFGAFELTQRRAAFARTQQALSTWTPEWVPRLLAGACFAAGLVLLASGATPAEPGRIEVLTRFLPLPVLELSHFVGSLVGMALLLLARAIQKRADGAYFTGLVLLALGAAASLLKGFDYEEALILGGMFLALLPCRRFFTRKSALLSHTFSLGWNARVAGALAATAFLVALAYRDVDFSSELVWQFELDAHVARSLRALVGAAALAGLASLAALLRPARVRHEPPTEAELERVRPLVASAARTSAHLALVGDKSLLVHENGDAFLMYGVQARTWVAMGDPVGPPDARRELAWRLRELADEAGGWAAFYEVGSDDLPVYLDLGLAPRKIGEEARVPLANFSLAGGGRKALRAAHNRALREGCAVEIVPPERVAPELDELEAISNAWLAAKHTREKRFSVGRFERAYLARTPVAIVRRGPRAVAFANLWLGAGREELSIDLMRYADDAPPGMMDYLLAELMLWGHEQKYRWFSLGVAPLSGLETHRLAPLWSRTGSLLFRSGEYFYGFQGLRAFKEKFDPVWEPRYLAAPGGLALPIVLSNIAALISGGITGVVAR